MLEIGSLVDGKYKILNKVGQGGMSVVYMAINEKANKTWAVKEVRKDGVLNFESVKQGLVAETNILKKLSHPNLPSIIDVIDTEDSFIIIMDYIYTVLAKNFADDGVYRLTFYSEDAAGNIAENTLDTKKQEIGFGVDKTKPNMVVTNLESDTTYPLENLTVSLSAGDNLLLQSVVVYLDDYSKAYKTWTAEEVAAIVADQGEFTFDIPGDSTGAHQVKIVCTDAAGNEQTEEITNFYVTTNLFVRYYNNKPLFFGSIAAVVVIAGVVIALAAGKKKKNDKEK